MRNLRMKEKLEIGTCLDVREIGVTYDEMVFELSEFEEDVDYADAKTERWVWSIGKRKSDGKIFASLDTRFYQNDDFVCLWLR